MKTFATVLNTKYDVDCVYFGNLEDCEKYVKKMQQLYGNDNDSRWYEVVEVETED